MHRLSDHQIQSLWDLRAAGAGARRIAITLAISRNTVRRYLRRGADGSLFPSPMPEAPAWHARAGHMLADESNASAVAVALRAEGVFVSARTVQRFAATWRQAGELQTA